MAVDTAFHPDIPTSDLRLIGSVAATNPKGIMEGMPSGRRPQPLGKGLWELVHGDLRMSLREQPRALEFASTQPDLDRAGALAKAAAGGRRLKVHASDLPPGMFSVDGVEAIPAGLRRQVSAVLREATRASFELDAGTDRDLILELAADAPFERLGLSPLGTARTQTTGLEGRLPAGAALVVAMPWGSPELLHKMSTTPPSRPARSGRLRDPGPRGGHREPQRARPGPERRRVRGLPGPRGQMTVLIAADVKDEAAVRKAAHDILTTASAGVAAFNALGGDKKEASFTVTLKEKGIKSGAVEGELLTLGLPKNMATDLDDARPLLTSKDQIELAAVVSGGSAVVTIGFDARRLATTSPAASSPPANRASPPTAASCSPAPPARAATSASASTPSASPASPCSPTSSCAPTRPATRTSTPPPPSCPASAAPSASACAWSPARARSPVV
jgi:hypothetical protein